MARYRLSITTCCVLFIFAALLRGQFNDNRRRQDLSPITLPGGSRIEFRSFDSNSIGMPARYSVFLPPSFSKDLNRTYPVIYFLHGLNNDETSWTVERYGSFQDRLEQMILSGKVPEFIMVHPRGDSSFYCNYIDGSKMYEDLIAREFIQFMETSFRARKGRENRAIAGTSMGGYGALKIAMKYPQNYAAVAAHSPILIPGLNPAAVPESMKSSRFYTYFIGMITPIFGNPIRQDLWNANNPLVLAKKGNLKDLEIYFDYGTDDRYIPTIRLDEGCRELDRILTGSGVSHVFKIHPGEPHGWALIANHLDETLPFLSRTFR